MQKQTYKIKEIFGPTIQGEGTCTGEPVLFLRFSGCNRWSGREKDKAQSVCKFCDTDFVGGQLMTSQEIVEQLNEKSNGIKTVVISGGEPCLQIKEELLYGLKMNNFKIHLETNGSIAMQPLLKYFSHITMSPKQGRQSTLLERCDDLKILYPWIGKDITAKNFSNFNYEQLYLQPQWGTSTSEICEQVYKTKGAKLSAQMHKYLEVE